MKYAVIDIGSNSVRLLLWADGCSISKNVITTRLGEGISFSPRLLPQAMERTVRAICEFMGTAREFGAQKIYAFATAAVRSAENGNDFMQTVYQNCGIMPEILSGKEEAEIGYLGALEGRDGGIIDVGGASSEIIIGKNGKIIYAVSADVGAVRLKDVCGEDKLRLKKYIDEKIAVYGDVPVCPMTLIGGTATSLAALEYRVEPYDPKVIHHSILTVEQIGVWAEKLLSMQQSERLLLKGMDKKRADILGGGALLLYEILRKIQAEKVSVSEADNTEGYLMKKLRENQNESRD